MSSFVEISERVKRLFWDAKKEEVDFYRHRSYIVSRIIDYGDTEDVKWMLKVYTPQQIVEVVKKRRGLSRKSALFGSTYFNIPREEIEYLKKSYH